MSDDLLSGCPVCSHLISKNTKSCPNCGEPNPFLLERLKEEYPDWVLLGGVILILIVVGLVNIFGWGTIFFQPDGSILYGFYRWFVSHFN